MTTSSATATSTRAIGYVRVSIEEQARDGLSMGAQRERIESYCHAKQIELLEILSDEGVSGKSLHNRPGILKALERAREESCTLVVVKLDRLSRKTLDILEILEDGTRGKWEVHSIDDSLDTGTAMGRFAVTMMAGLAQLEREQISERTKKALAFKKRQGHEMGAPAFGERVVYDEKGLRSREADPKEMKVLERLRELKAEGLSNNATAQQLNEEGLGTKRGGKWTHVQVGRVLERIGASCE